MNTSFPLFSQVCSYFCSSSPSPKTWFVLCVGPWIKWLFSPFLSSTSHMYNHYKTLKSIDSSQFHLNWRMKENFNFHVTYKFYHLRVLKMDSIWRWIFCLFSWLLMSSLLWSSYIDTKNQCLKQGIFCLWLCFTTSVMWGGVIASVLAIRKPIFSFFLPD